MNRAASGADANRLPGCAVVVANNCCGGVGNVQVNSATRRECRRRRRDLFELRKLYPEIAHVLVESAEYELGRTDL